MMATMNKIWENIGDTVIMGITVLLFGALLTIEGFVISFVCNFFNFLPDLSFVEGIIISTGWFAVTVVAIANPKTSMQLIDAIDERVTLKEGSFLKGKMGTATLLIAPTIVGIIIGTAILMLVVPVTGIEISLLQGIIFYLIILAYTMAKMK